MEVTYKKLQNLAKAIEGINMKETKMVDDKINYALIKNYDRIDTLLSKDYRKSVLKINLDYCIYDTDSSGNQIPRKDKNEFVFSKESIIPRLEKLEALDEQTTEFNPYTYKVSEELAEYLGEVILEIFEGILVKE